MIDFLNNDTYDWVLDDSSGVIDIVGTCGAQVVSQNIKTRLARYDNYSLLTDERITITTRRQVLSNYILSTDGVSSVDTEQFNPVLNDDSNCRTGYSYGTICPTIDCDNSKACTISF